MQSSFPPSGLALKPAVAGECERSLHFPPCTGPLVCPKQPRPRGCVQADLLDPLRLGSSTWTWEPAEVRSAEPQASHQIREQETQVRGISLHHFLMQESKIISTKKVSKNVLSIPC